MKRRIVTGVMIGSLLVAQFTGVSVVFSDELQGKQLTEQSDGSIVSSFDDSITKDIFKESIVPIAESNSEIKGTEDSIFETSNMSEEITETSEAIESTESTNEMETKSSNSEGVKEEITSSSSEELSESTEVIEQEKVFYNNQWLEFPIQKETVEVEKKQKTNNTLGTYAKPKDYASLSFEKITEEQANRPKWDVIDVSSEHGELSVADYEYMKIHGVTGVVVKLTEGTYYKNPFAKIQIENAEKAGLKVSTYHFSHYTTKNGAEAEAIYYAEEAKRLNLTVNTVMVNNLELNLNEYATQNAIFFANKLKELGYGNLIHASSAKAFSEGKLLPAILGEEYLWIVDYQNQPTAENMQHLQNTAWKWSDKMEFMAIPGKSFGVSSDYQGKFSNPIQIVTDDPEKSKNTLDIFEKNINQYITITTKDFVVWEDLTLKKEIYKSVDYFRQTLFAEKEFTLLNGMKILSIKDNKKKHLGYINKLDTNIEEAAHGTHQKHGKYVSIKGNYDIWQDFDWKKSKSGSTYKNQTYEAREIYHHFNGSRYLSLYDNKGKWLGYINEWGTSSGNGDQGPHQNYGKYVSIKGNYDIWEGFDWKKSKSGLNHKNQTFEARGIYHHFNGSRYLSLYDNKGKWLGYINEWGTSLGSGSQGPYQKYGEYVSIKGNYDIWEGFDWKKSKLGSTYKNQIFEAKGVYHHFNGSRYLSLYDSKGKWIGYINEVGTSISNSLQGNYKTYNKYVTVKSNTEPVYRNFNWVLQQTGKIGKETFKAKGVYHHFNGTRYFSIYDLKNKWIGYISENSVDEKPTHLFVMGHGSYDPGAVGNGTSEREFTRIELLPYLQKHAKKLKNSEVLFYDTSRNMYTDSQKKEGIHTVHAGLSSITELHLDAAGVGATGGHVIVHPNKKSYKEDFELANVVKTYNGLWGGVANTKGLSYRKDLLNLNLSFDYDVSYRLVELGFITNYKDLVKLRVNLDRIAKEFIEVVTGEKI